MTAPRITWRMVKFTALQGGPAYTDLGQVAAILDTAEPRLENSDSPMLPVNRGATICLACGFRYYVRETADTVFEEVRRYRTEQEPAPPRMKMPDAAPADTVAAPGEEGGPQTHDG